MTTIIRAMRATRLAEEGVAADVGAGVVEVVVGTMEVVEIMVGVTVDAETMAADDPVVDVEIKAEVEDAETMATEIPGEEVDGKIQKRNKREQDEVEAGAMIPGEEGEAGGMSNQGEMERMQRRQKITQQS